MRGACSLLLGSLLSITGCGFIEIVPAGSEHPKGGKSDGTLAEASYVGPECKGDGATGERLMILQQICKQYSTTNIEALHERFDDRRPNMIVAATITHAGARNAHSPLRTAIAAHYASVVEPKALQAALDKVDLSSEARVEFYQTAIAAKSVVLANVAKLDARRRHMYVETPGAVVAKRKEYFKAHAAEYAQLDAAEAQIAQAYAAKKNAADLAPNLAALRADYFSKCTSDDCRYDLLPLEISRELVNVYVAAKDPLRAAAEGVILRDPAASRHVFSAEMGTAIYQAMQDERREYDAYETAKRQGLDDASLKVRFGDPIPVQVDPTTDWIGRQDSFDPNWTRSEHGYTSLSGVVKAVTASKETGPRGERLALVTFRDIVSQSDVESCHETKRVESVTLDSSNRAQLNYQTVCKTVGQKTNVEKISPALVPASEVASVKPGETLVAYVDGDSSVGVVVTTYTNAKPAKVAKAATTKGGKSKKAKAPPKDADDAGASDKVVILQVRGERIGQR